MKSNLFIELSEEQQEVVAGGIDGLVNTTFFNQRIAIQTGTTASGPNGSTSTSAQGSDERSTGALQAGALGFLTFGGPVSIG